MVQKKVPSGKEDQEISQLRLILVHVIRLFVTFIVLKPLFILYATQMGHVRVHGFPSTD